MLPARLMFPAGRVKETARQVKGKILQLAAQITGIAAEGLDLADRQIVNLASGEGVISLAQLALSSHYHLQLAAPISAEVSQVTRA